MNPPALAPSEAEPIVSFRKITKRFGATLAVDNVDLDIAPGEIHALLGANGAGKSTLIKLLAGIHQPDAGEIYLKGQPIQRRRSERSHIAFIHQDLGLVDWMTVSENIALVSGYERRGGLIDWAKTTQKSEGALGVLGSEIPPETPAARLSQPDKALVAIARALAVGADLVVLDEPTASLPESDVSRLFRVLRRLRAHGVAMIYVSHRLDEVFRLADRVTVLRDGKKVHSSPVKDTHPAELVVLIVGRPPAELFVKPEAPARQAVLEARSICVGGIGPVSLRIAGGEILALTGLRGAGQDVIGRAICGIERISSGTVEFAGRPLALTGPGDAVAHGIRFVSSKRHEEGLAPRLTVKENLFLNPAAGHRRIQDFESRSHESERARQLALKFAVRPPDPDRLIGTLSGGNQQKVLLARSLGVGSKLLVLEEPTQGVDIGAKAEIYQIIVDSLDASNAVLLVSSDLEEVAGIATRALIFNREAAPVELKRSEMSLPRLTQLVTGADSSASVSIQ